MKKQLNAGIFILLTTTAALLSNCSKKPSDIVTPILLVGADNMFPVTQSQSASGGNQFNFTYTYDKNNNLIRYGQDSYIVRDINAHGVLATDFGSPDIFQQGYAFSLFGQIDTAVDIYTATPTQVHISYFHKNLTTGVTSSSPGSIWNFETDKSGQVIRETTSDLGGYNYNYSYDSKGNLAEVDYVSLSGPRAGAFYSRLKVTAVDDKNSPFSKVKGYRFISYPALYGIDYALEMCKNNPTEITSEAYDTDKNKFVLYEKDEFSYVYNDKGYPTTINETITYYTAVTTTYHQTYTFTYKTK